MATDPGAIDGAFYGELRRHYSDEEIVELGAFIGFNIGFHTFFGTLEFYPMFAPDGRLVTPGGIGAHLRRRAAFLLRAMRESSHDEQ